MARSRRFTNGNLSDNHSGCFWPRLRHNDSCDSPSICLKIPSVQMSAVITHCVRNSRYDAELRLHESS